MIGTERRNSVRKSLTRLREFRKEHNLCRECGSVKEPERTERRSCSRCAGIIKNRRRSQRAIVKQRKIMPVVMPVGVESSGRTDHMMELSALLSKRVVQRVACEAARVMA